MNGGMMSCVVLPAFPEFADDAALVVHVSATAHGDEVAPPETDPEFGVRVCV